MPGREEDIPERAERPKKKRREKAKPLKFGLDSGGDFHMENMLMSSPENTKAAHLAALGNSGQKEDAELYGQLPCYGDFQCYELGHGGILHHVAQRIYANLHMPSCRTLKRRLFSVEDPKKIFRGLKSIEG